MRIGVAAGLVSMLCCVGPTVLAVFGAISAATAYAWATELYDGYAWWFRLVGAALLVGLTVVAMRRRNQCHLTGVRRMWPKIVAAVAVALGTYVLLYALTTWLGALTN